jgi:hypothetical protein
MNVIRHYDPGAQVITLAVKESHRFFDKLGNFLASQMALAPSTVKIRFQLHAALLVVLNL